MGVVVQIPPIHALAALGKDGETLTLGVINPRGGENRRTTDVPLPLKGIDISGDGTLHQIAHDDPMAFSIPGKNPHPGKEPTSGDRRGGGDGNYRFASGQAV